MADEEKFDRKEFDAALIEYMSRPIDISKKTNDLKASTLALSFIGYVSKPTGISEELYQKCVKAFQECVAGKIEREIEAIQKVLDENEGKQ